MKSLGRILSILCLAAALLAIAGCPSQQTAATPGSGPAQVAIEEIPATPAPDFTLKTPDGGKTSLADYTGKILVLDFWATFCTGCVEELPAYQTLYDSWDHNRVAYLGISLDTNLGLIEAFLKSHPELTLPMALGDEPMLEAYLGSRRTIPVARVIDPKGMIRYEFGPGASSEQVAAAVQRLLAEMNAAPAR